MRGLHSIFFIAGMVMAAFPAIAVEMLELHQTACQFIEPEGDDQHYQAESFAACQSFNDKTGEDRLGKAEVLQLKPGEYLFRVHNRDVPYELGFWLRGEGIGRLTLPAVSGGGISTGGYKDYRITLKEGEYLYSCPLNPTPDYKLVVQ
ncbi:MAG: hypothetical protein R8K54_02085 [Mariprofundaceae bacterium]